MLDRQVRDPAYWAGLEPVSVDLREEARLDPPSLGRRDEPDVQDGPVLNRKAGSSRLGRLDNNSTHPHTHSLARV